MRALVGVGAARAGAGVDPRNSAWPVVGALVATAALLAIALGPAGLLVALVTIACWIALAHGGRAGVSALAVPFAVAGGHVALAVLAPADLAPLAIVAIEAGFAGIVVASSRPRGRPTVAAVVAIAGLGGATWLPLRAGSPWLAGLVLLLALSLASYAVHRVTLVRFDLVSDAADETGALSATTPPGPGPDAATGETSTADGGVDAGPRSATDGGTGSDPTRRPDTTHSDA